MLARKMASRDGRGMEVLGLSMEFVGQGFGWSGKEEVDDPAVDLVGNCGATPTFVEHLKG